MSQGITTREVAILLTGGAAFHFLSSSLLGVGFYLDLMLALTVYVANYSDPARAALLGCVFGLVQDVSGLHPLWGLNGFSKTLIGCSSYYLIRYLVVESSAGRAALLFFLSLLDGVIIYAFLLLLTTTPALTHGVIAQVLLKALLTASSGAALFWLLDRRRFPAKDYRHLGA